MPDGLGAQKKKIAGVVDVVFCIDCTGSMQPCIDGLKANVGRFVETLKEPVQVDSNTVVKVQDWRARIVGFRDFDEDAEPLVADFEFVPEAEALRRQLGDPRIQATGGGDEPESALDAIYVAATQSDWRREGESRRFIVVFTDAPTKPELSPKTRPDPPRDVDIVCEALRTRRIKPVFIGRADPNFEAILERGIGADNPEDIKKVSRFAPTYEQAQELLGTAQMRDLLVELAKEVSSLSVPDDDVVL